MVKVRQLKVLSKSLGKIVFVIMKQYWLCEKDGCNLWSSVSKSLLLTRAARSTAESCLSEKCKHGSVPAFEQMTGAVNNLVRSASGIAIFHLKNMEALHCKSNSKLL